MKTKKILLLLFIICMAAACKKKKSVQPEFSCEKTTAITRQSFGDLAMIIEYANGKISKVYREDKKGLTENYRFITNTDLEITRTFSDGSVGNLFKVVLNETGYFSRFTQISTVAPYTYDYTYDAQGYLTDLKASFPLDPPSDNQARFTYQNGNLVRKTTLKKNVTDYTEDFTYYEDMENKADLIANENRPAMAGRLNKNLLKSWKITYADGSSVLSEYTYVRNTYGFVTSLTEKHTDKNGRQTSQINTFEYTCL